MQNFWVNFCHSNDTWWRLARTIVQGIVSVFVEYRFAIAEAIGIPEELRGAVVMLMMAILSPIMSEIGMAIDKKSKNG